MPRVVASWGSRESQFWLFAGRPSCSYMFLDHMKVVELIAQEVFHRFPDRSDRRLWIGDCSPYNGSCSGHDGGGHGSKYVFDANYYTTGPNNCTQYRPDSSHPITPIWDGDRLLTDIFDWERNYWFIKMLYRAFRNAGNRQFILDILLVQHITAKVYSVYGRQAAVEFGQMVSGDTPNNLRHNTHMHLSLGISPDYSITVGDLVA